MLKRIGIVTAGATVGLIGLTPVAFASDPTDVDARAGLQVDIDDSGVFVGQGCKDDVSVAVFDTPVSVRQVAASIGLTGAKPRSILAGNVQCTVSVDSTTGSLAP